MYITPEFRKKLIAFHGDACPISVLGVRMGLTAMNHFAVKEKSPRNFIVITENRACIVDGIQFITGCTVGAGSIIAEDYGKLGAIFFHRASDSNIRIKLAPEIAEEFEETGKDIIENILSGGKFSDNKQKKGLLKKFMKLPESQLFEIRSVKLAEEIRAPTRKQFLLQRGFIVHRTRCDSCGEYVEETKTVTKDGKRFCIPCAGLGLYSIE